MGAANIVVFYIAEKLHKSEADRIVKLINKLDADDVQEAIKPYRRKFLGLKIINFIMLYIYAYLSALIIFMFLPVPWLSTLVFFGTIVINWSFFVTNASIRFLMYHELQMRKNGTSIEQDASEVEEGEIISEDELVDWSSIKKGK